MSKIHLVIPDSHSHPQFNNRRYSVLGQFICDLKPDTVIDIGDWWDMPSLSSYDKGHASFEGRRYRLDLDAGLEAQDRMFTPIRKAKKRRPRFVRTLGNHENRIARALEQSAILIGTIGLKDLQSKEYGWEEYPFLEPAVIDGVTYQHYFTSGVAGRPIGGEHAAYSLLTKQFTSCTQGHTHTLDHCVRSTIDGRKLHGLVVGCFQDYKSEWAGPANEVWNSGIVVKHEVENGQYDLEWVSMQRLFKMYPDVS